MTTDIAHAQQNIKKRLTTEDGVILAVHILTMKRIPHSTSRKVKFFIAPGEPGSGAIQDVTGVVARAIGKQWNNKDGTFLVKGGDGSDAIDNLSIQLFDDHRAIRSFPIL